MTFVDVKKAMHCAEDLQRGWSDMCLLLDRRELQSRFCHVGARHLLGLCPGWQPGAGGDRPERTEVRSALAGTLRKITPGKFKDFLVAASSWPCTSAQSAALTLWRLLEVALDAAWASFEKKYISELIQIEDKANRSSSVCWRLSA